MIRTNRLLKVASVWISVVYVVCYAVVALAPGIRAGFMKYALHTSVDTGQNILSFGIFISGLIIWNAVTLLSVWLFAFLYNKMK